MKKYFLGLIIGFGLAFAGVALAINVTIPQATGYGVIPRGNANGTYTPVATSTLGLQYLLSTTTATCSGNTTCSSFIILGSSPVTISSSGGSGSVTNIATTYPILGGPITTTGTLSLAFGTTTNNGMTAGFLYSGSGGIWQTSASSTLNLPNSALANSTISGIALGSSLADLTAIDSTLTLSGTYNGGTARTIGLNLGSANTWTALQTINFASTTAITASGELVIPNGSTKGSTVAGQIELDTTNDQLKVGDGSATAIFDPRISFTFGIATTTTWTGSTTAPVVPIPTGITWNTVLCNVQPAGATLNVQYQYANPTSYITVSPTMIGASSTQGTFNWTTNNTPATNASSTITFGTPASSPMSISCTLTGVTTGT